VDWTNYAPETASPKRNERDRNRTKTNQRSPSMSQRPKRSGYGFGRKSLSTESTPALARITATARKRRCARSRPRERGGRSDPTCNERREDADVEGRRPRPDGGTAGPREGKDRPWTSPCGDKEGERAGTPSTSKPTFPTRGQCEKQPSCE